MARVRPGYPGWRQVARGGVEELEGIWPLSVSPPSIMLLLNV
jgi:hypothetical protein